MTKSRKGKNEFPIRDLLCHGKENATPTPDLARLLNCSEREIRSEVKRERLHGALICSSTSAGYWLPEEASDLIEFIRVQNARIKSMRMVTTCAKRELLKWKGEKK